jgi:putative acetyltransferase
MSATRNNQMCRDTSSAYAPGMHLREELPADRDAVCELNVRAFGDHHGPVVADLVTSLRDTIPRSGGLSLVAERDGQIVGHVMFTHSLLDAPRRLVDVQVLSPLAVAPDFQRQGIGSALVQQGLKVMAEREVPLVFLEGDPRYYSRFGFLAGGDHGFHKPSLRIPDAGFQVVRLPRYEPWMIGTLVYSEPFWRHDCVGLRDPAASVESTRPSPATSTVQDVRSDTTASAATS